MLSEHDIFLADDRVIMMLPKMLGKIFYKTAAKRPIPVSISGVKKAKGTGQDAAKSMATPKAMANEITRALSAALIHLSPSTSTAIRVAKASWNEEMVVENIEAVVQGMIEKFVPQKWRNVKSLHIKGPNTTGLPLWMADELWLNEEDVIEDAPAEDEGKATDASNRKVRKRKRKGDAENGEKSAKRRKETAKKQITNGETMGEYDFDLELEYGKQRLKRQKMAARAEFELDRGADGTMKEDSKTAAVQALTTAQPS